MSNHLIDLQTGLAKTTAREAKAACDEEREVTATIDGVDVVLKYEGTQGLGTVMVYSGVFLNGERFGTETERHPWSIFENSRTWYEVGDLLLKPQAEAIIRRARVQGVTATEEPYPAETGPVRYFFTAASLEAVVQLWKTLKATRPSTYLPTPP